jgi:hypothetical protein
MAFGMAGMFGVPCRAADRVLLPPTGWMIDPGSSPYAMTSNTIAVASYQGVLPYANSMVTQYSGLNGATVTAIHTQIAGGVFLLEYSSSGAYLLAHQQSESDPEGQRVTLLNSAGEVLWSRADTRIFHFSTTGEALFAGGSPGDRSSEVEIFSLSGQSKKIISPPHYANTVGQGIDSFLLVGNGASAVVSNGGMTSRVKLDATATTLWSFADSSSVAPQVFESHLLDSDRVLLRMSRGCFKVVRLSDGSTDYTYDPGALAGEVLEHNAAYWGGFSPFPGSAPGTLTLFDGTPAAYTLDLTTDTLTARTIAAASPPAGFTFRNRIDAQRFVFLSATQIRIRTIPS